MKRRVFLASTLASASLPPNTLAQTLRKVAHIGWVTAQQASSLATNLEAFRAGLAALGYVEGQNFVIDIRYADDDYSRVPQLARELERLPVDVLIAQSGAAFEVRDLGLTVPVVYVMSADPVSAGFAESMSHPRDNMTGLTFMAFELAGKRLELLKEIIPDFKRVAIVGNPEHPGAHLERAFSEDTALRLGLVIAYFPTPNRDALIAALTAIGKDPPQAISILADGFAMTNRDILIDFANSHHIPAVSGWPAFAQAGALFTYGPRLTDSSSPAGELCRSHPERREAGRPSGRAAEQFSIHRQPADRKGSGTDGSASGARASRRRYRMSVAGVRPRRPLFQKGLHRLVCRRGAATAG